MSRENTAQFFLKKAAHNYSQLFPGDLKIDGSAAALVATRVSTENGLPAKRKASLHKNGLVRLTRRSKHYL
jgi:hypothetical protein